MSQSDYQQTAAQQASSYKCLPIGSAGLKLQMFTHWLSRPQATNVHPLAQQASSYKCSPITYSQTYLTQEIGCA